MMFHHLAHLFSQFCHFHISRSRNRQGVKQQKSKSTRPPRSDKWWDSPVQDSHPKCELHEGVRGQDDGGEREGLHRLFQDLVDAPVRAQVEVHQLGTLQWEVKVTVAQTPEIDYEVTGYKIKSFIM